MEKSKAILFQLLRVALGNEGTDTSLPNDVSWQDVFDLSVKQGVVNVAYDGLQMLMNANPEKTFGFDTPEMEVLRYKWIGYGMTAENAYQQYVSTLKELAQLYQSQGFQLVLFKGYALSRYYPFPSHRPVGDIDIAVLNAMGEWSQRQADEKFRKELGLPVEKAKNTHHSKYLFRGLSVENHYEFSSTYRSDKKSKEFEALLQSLCLENGIESTEEGIIFAPPTFNALFLMWHLASHFCSSYISLRQLCDYMLFLEHDYKKVDWVYVKKIFREYGLAEFAQVVDGILVQYLHAKRSIYGDGVCLKDIETRVVEDIFNAKEYKFESKIVRLLRYPQFSWKYRLVRDRSWFSLLYNSIQIHLFHKKDLIKESI